MSFVLLAPSKTIEVHNFFLFLVDLHLGLVDVWIESDYMIWKGIIRTKRNEIDKGRNVILLYHMNMIIGFVAVPVRIELIETDSLYAYYGTSSDLVLF